MLSQPLSFVDLETTGTSANFNRIIEIGIIKVHKNKIIKKYETLVNPGVAVDPFIQEFTGIRTQDLANAPTFYDIKDELLEILKDSIFVAHNVRFDYGFIKNEFRRFDITFSSKHFCTVKLSRLLFPEWKRYNLDVLIDRFNFKVEKRHRAFSDAWVLWEFYKKVRKQIAQEKFEHALDLAMKRPTVPLNLSTDILDSLPESPGVYIFYGDQDTPLYIGKSINIHDRVLSHFSSDLISGKEMKLSQQVKRIETIKTAGELGALLLESSLVKKLQPIYNRTLRIGKKMLALKKKTDRDGFNTVGIASLGEIPVGELDTVVAVFKSEKSLKDALYGLVKTYGLCPKLLNLEKTGMSCFSYHLGYCKGVCIGKENRLKYNLRFDEAFYKLKIKSWPFNGKIIIREKSDFEEAILIDKWCVLGSLKENDQDLAPNDDKYVFDYDTYKILVKYINAPGVSLSSY